ncbi:MAG: phosphate butyryltransferase [Acidobacteria bacterium]|nr:phosphate butyryltransferase [Acidobacteriota bacterium]
MPITQLDQILEAVRGRPRKRLAAAVAQDAHTLEAVLQAVAGGIVDGILTGDEPAIRDMGRSEGLDLGPLRIHHEPDPLRAAALAVDLVNAGEADLLMKGSLSTDRYMRAILDKDRGLVDPGGILSHVTVVQHPRYPKLLVCGDLAVIPEPDLAQKLAITAYVIQTLRTLGIPQPKVALVAASEQVLPKYRHSTEAALIAKMADRGQFPGAWVDGPMGLDAAVDPEAARIKGLGGPVAGDADGLVFANIEGGNVFYKTSTKLAGAEVAAMVVGARVPCILSSRGDSTRTKLCSIALAALAAG